jgi:hypothetical protein
MSPHRERVLRGTVSSEHLVQLFDEPESRALSVAEFLHEGWQRGDHLLVVARAANWALTVPVLEARGCPVADTIARGRLIVLDAATTMATFMAGGEPDRDRFQTAIGDLVSRLAGESRAGLSVYGEMVDLLVAQGNFAGAGRLEASWNELSQTCSFRLLCGYTAAHFGDESTTGHLHAICGMHGSSSARSTDLLATWLLANRRPRYHLDQL